MTRKRTYTPEQLAYRRKMDKVYQARYRENERKAKAGAPRAVVMLEHRDGTQEHLEERDCDAAMDRANLCYLHLRDSLQRITVSGRTVWEAS